MGKQTINLMNFFRVVWECIEAGGRETIIKPLKKSRKQEYEPGWSGRVIEMKVLVTRLCLTLFNTMDCSPPGSAVHGILQRGILEWVAIPFSNRNERNSLCIEDRKK